VLSLTVLGERPDDGADRPQVGISGVGGGRPDRDEEQARVLHDGRELRREVQSVGHLRQELAEARLVDRHLARL
jgi:hypothetical protein